MPRRTLWKIISLLVVCGLVCPGVYMILMSPVDKNSVLVWRTESGHPGTGLAKFSSDGKTILQAASSNLDRWDAATGKHLTPAPPSAGKARSPNLQWEVYEEAGNGSRRTLCVRNTETGQVLRRFQLPASINNRRMHWQSEQTVFHPSLPWICTCYTAGNTSSHQKPEESLLLLNAETGAQQVLPRRSGGALDAPENWAFTENGNELLWVTTVYPPRQRHPSPSQIHLVNLLTGKIRLSLSSPGDEPILGKWFHTATSPDNALLASVNDSGGQNYRTGDGRVFMFDLATNKILWRLSEPNFEVNAIAVSPDSRWLACGGRDWNEPTGYQARGKLLLLDAHTGALAATLSTETLLDKTWKEGPTSAQPPPYFPGDSGPINSVDFSPDGKSLLSGHEGGRICLWRVPR